VTAILLDFNRFVNFVRLVDGVDRWLHIPETGGTIRVAVLERVEVAYWPIDTF
jgi:hypothetical protein